MRWLVTNGQLRRELRAAERTIEARDMRIAGLIIDRDATRKTEERLAEQHTRVAEQHRMIVERNARIQHLQDYIDVLIVERDAEVLALRDRIADGDAELSALREQIANDRAEFTEIMDQLTHSAAQEIHRLHREVERLKSASIARLYASSEGFVR